jgi:sugar phosphate isomerase/epimerase
MRLAGWNYSYEKMPIEESVAHMASLGFEGMELATGEAYSTPIETLDDRRVDEVKRLLERHRIEPVAVSALWRLAPPSEEWERDEWPRWRRSIEVAARLGARLVGAGSGHADPAWPRERLWQALLANGRRVAEYAGERGVVVAIEPHWGAAVERPGDAVELVLAVGLPSLRINADVCHPFALGYDLESIARVLLPWAVYAHVCDVRGRHPGGPPPAQHQLVNPGEGEIDWVRWLGLLGQSGQVEWITTQVSVMRKAWPGYEPKAAMAQIRGYLTEAMAKAGVADRDR